MSYQVVEQKKLVENPIVRTQLRGTDDDVGPSWTVVFIIGAVVTIAGMYFKSKKARA